MIFCTFLSITVNHYLILYSFSSIEVSGCDSQSINTSPWRPWEPPPLGGVIPQTQPAVRTAPPHQLQKPQGVAKSVWFIDFRFLWKSWIKSILAPSNLDGEWILYSVCEWMHKLIVYLILLKKYERKSEQAHISHAPTLVLVNKAEYWL